MSTKPKKRIYRPAYIAIAGCDEVGYCVWLCSGAWRGRLHDGHANRWDTIEKASRVAQGWGKRLGLEVREAK